ncbi:MAG: AAA family ATPase [Lachnospiraceae bacterium]
MNNKTDLIRKEIKKVIQSKDEVIRLTLCAILAGGHVLLEDIPGVGKTTLAMSFARAMSLSYKRMQFTPDVLPSDLIGYNLYDKSTNSFRFQEGCVYTNLFLADEINRTSPKTQSALLEVMEEGQATVEGVTRRLPQPFFVIATENPFGSSGTQKLPESQLDRFMICLSIGYPDTEGAVSILKGNSSANIDLIEQVVNTEELLKMQKQTEELFVDEALYDYIVELTETTRNPEYFMLGLSPRGSIALLKMAKAYAYVNGRNFLLPEDIHDVFYSVASHRVRLSAKARAAGQTTEEVLSLVLKQVSIPKISQ